MSNDEFRTTFKKWLNHKIILSQSSVFYKDKLTTVKVLKDNFSSFLTFSANYSVGQLALLIKRNQGLLEFILPIPNNPSYETAKLTLTQILDQANKIITENNLTDIV